METTKRKRTREEVRAAFREYLDDKKKRMEEKQRELEEIHEMRMSGMTMENLFIMNTLRLNIINLHKARWMGK